METQILEYDALTGALTRSTFAFRLNEEHERALRYHLPFSLVVVDLDHFKSINDAFGHARGDQVLIEFARRTQATLRTNDLIFRYGGDEFVLLLPYTTRVEAASLAKRLLDTIQSLPFGSNPPITLTLSIGIAAFPEDAETIEDLFEAADKRSYAAKRAGRARIVAENLDTAARITHLPEPGRLLERDQAQEKLQDFLKVLTLRQRGILLVEGPEKAGHSRLVNEARKLARLQGYATLALQAQPGFKSRRYAALFTALTEQAHLPYLPQDEQTLATALAHWISDKGYAGLIVTIDNPAEIDLSSLAFLLYLFNTACLPALALVWAGRGGLEWANRFSNPPLQEIIKILPLSLPSLRIWLRHSLQWEAPGPLLEWFFDQTGGLPGLIQGGLELMLAHKMLRPASEKDKGWETADNWKSFSLAEKQAQRRDATTLHNLPSGLTELIGRDLELRQLSERLSQQQLVSLVGPGGIGKTRLALQVAAESLEKYSQGIYFVALAGLEAEEMVLGAISAAIGLETDGAKLKTQLLNYLRDREILLVLDNFEHLLPHTSLLLTLLEAAPQLRLLVTTREPLNLPGEQIILLAGLSYPPETVVTNLEDYAAIQLFRQNARLVQAEFGLDRENGPSVARICRVMQGLPLGINLMAAWVNTFSPAQIATWLENQEADFWQTFPSNPAILYRRTEFCGEF